MQQLQAKNIKKRNSRMALHPTYSCGIPVSLHKSVCPRCTGMSFPQARN